MTCWPRAPCRLSICSLYSLSGLLSFSLSSFPALVLKDLFCSLHAQTVAQFRITCTELWSPIKEGLWIGVDLQMLLHPAVMVNEPHESQELLCFNPWRLYYESMMIWYIGLLWHPHWYFIWFLIFAQQERSKCSDLSCPHYISPIKQLDTVIFLPHFPFEVTALPHYYTLVDGRLTWIWVFVSLGLNWPPNLLLSIICILCLLSSPLCSVFIIDSEASNIWSGQIWLLGTLAFIADHSIFKCGLTPFRWSLLNILTVCCTSLSLVVHCLPKTEQPVIDYATMTWARDTFHPSETSPTHPGTLLCWGSWCITLYSWLLSHLKYVIGLYFMTPCLCSNVSDRTIVISWNHASERHHLSAIL